MIYILPNIIVLSIVLLFLLSIIVFILIYSLFLASHTSFIRSRLRFFSFIILIIFFTEIFYNSANSARRFSYSSTNTTHTQSLNQTRNNLNREQNTTRKLINYKPSYIINYYPFEHVFFSTSTLVFIKKYDIYKVILIAFFLGSTNTKFGSMILLLIWNKFASVY